MQLFNLMRYYAHNAFCIVGGDMKKLLSIVTVLLRAVCLVACAKTETPKEKTTVNLGLLKGPTGIGAVYLLEGETENIYNHTLFASPTDITAKIISKELDIAAVPTNLASVLYNKTEGAIQILALNTFSTLYIVSTDDSIKSVNDLEGKTILLAGQGATPEYALDYVLTNSNLKDKVTIEYASEHAEVVTALSEGKADIVVLPEPNVTTALMKCENAKAVLNLGDLWTELSNGGELSMGCVVVNREFAQANPDAVTSFLAEYARSIDKVNSDTETAGALCEKFEIVPKAAVAQKAIPRCAIRFESGDTMKAIVNGCLEILHSYNPSAVGGKLPADDFYYGI